MIYKNIENNKMFAVYGESLEIPKYYIEEVDGKLYYMEDYDGEESEKEEVKFEGSIEEFYIEGGNKGLWEVFNVTFKFNAEYDFRKDFL